MLFETRTRCARATAASAGKSCDPNALTFALVELRFSEHATRNGSATRSYRKICLLLVAAPLR
jgi:hypothetical protein